MALGPWIGAGLGVAGGLVGTWLGVRNTQGPVERAFVLRMALIVWVLVILFVVGIVCISSPARYLLWIPYGLAMAFGIPAMNRRQRRIREGEARR